MKEDDKYFWLSSDFDLLTRDTEVQTYAKQRLPLLNSVVHLKFDRYINWIQVDDVYYCNSDGHLVRNGAWGEWVYHARPDESSLRAANKARPSIMDILLIARNNRLVEEALQHYATPHNWYSLEKVFEIIADDAGKKENDGRLKRGTFNTWTQGRDFGKHAPGKSFDFLQSAHSYDWSKLGARHSSVASTARTGVNPMSLEEAIEYITDLFIKWLQTTP